MQNLSRSSRSWIFFCVLSSSTGFKSEDWDFNGIAKTLHPWWKKHIQIYWILYWWLLSCWMFQQRGCWIFIRHLLDLHGVQDTLYFKKRWAPQRITDPLCQTAIACLLPESVIFDSSDRKAWLRCTPAKWCIGMDILRMSNCRFGNLVTPKCFHLLQIFKSLKKLIVSWGKMHLFPIWNILIIVSRYGQFQVGTYICI